MTYRKLNDLILLMKHIVIVEMHSSDQEWGVDMSAHLPEPGGCRGHGNPKIQGSTVLAEPTARKKKHDVRKIQNHKKNKIKK